MKTSQLRLNFYPPDHVDIAMRRMLDRLETARKQEVDAGSRVSGSLPSIKHLIK